MGELRLLTGKSIKLVSNSENLIEISAVEAYRAATLGCYGIKSSGYKEKSQKSVREDIISSLTEHLTMQSDVDLLELNTDALDSAVCFLATKDFINGF